MMKPATASATSLRLFYALWPDDATRDALVGLQKIVRGRTTEKQNLHLTLAFLGQQRAETVPTLREILLELPRQDMALVLDRFGYFSRQKIAWIAMTVVPD